MDEKLDALAKTTLFAGLGKKHLELIGRVTDRVELDEGRMLIHEGQVTTHMAIFVSGGAKVVVDDTEVARVGPGDIVGELSMVDDSRASATVTTTEPSVVWLIARAGFRPVWEDNPEMSRSMLLAVIEKLRETNELLHH